MTIPRPALQNALDCLEKYANHPATAAIHDPIYALLQGDVHGQQEALERALMAHASHPASVELRSFLVEHVSLGPTSLAGVLERHGPIQNREDLVHEVERRLQQYDKRLVTMKRERDHLERALSRANQSANAVAALGAFGALFALVVWAIALGLLDVEWMDAPVPEAPASAASGQGVPTPNQSRSEARP